MRRRGRIWADFCGAYGFWPGRRFTYSRFVALYLNISRIRLQRAWSITLGESAARSTRRLSYSWFDAIALDEEEAEEMSFEVNARRMEARSERRK